MKKRALGRLMVALGIVLGFSGLVLASQIWINDVGDSPRWLQDWLGQGVFGVVALIASSIALRNRRRAVEENSRQNRCDSHGSPTVA